VKTIVKNENLERYKKGVARDRSGSRCWFGALIKVQRKTDRGNWREENFSNGSESTLTLTEVEWESVGPRESCATNWGMHASTS